MIELYAIQWQRLGRLLNSLGKPERAALCAGFSARVFRHTGAMRGYIRSRLDALRFVEEVRDPQLVIEGARELLEEIRLLINADANGAGEFRDREVECLCVLAAAQYAARPERPQILSLEMSFKSERKNEEVATQPPETDSLPDLDTSEELAEPPQDSEKNEEQDLDETPFIFVQRVTINNKQPFILDASIHRVDWYDTFQEAAKLAAEYKMNKRWFNVWLQLLERSKSFKSADLTLYLYRVMNAQAKELGLKEMPPEFENVLLLVVGSSLNAATTGDREHFFSSIELEPALDRWSEQLKDSKDSLKDSVSQHKWIGEVWAMEAGELFEAANRYADAKRAYLRVVRFSEQRLQSATEPRYIEYLTTVRVTGLYRTARASLKDFLENPEHDKLVECLNTIELYKARSVLKDPYKALDAKVDSSQNGSSATSLFESAKVAEWVDLLPPSTGVMVFALLQETELNKGFWFSAFVVPHTGSIINPRLIKFDEIYQPYLAVTAAFDQTRAAINSMSLAAAAAEAERNGSALNEALENLGDALFPPEIVADIEREKLKRLVIVPESYLFDVPFPALSVQSQNSRQRLFQLNEKSGGLALSVAPNLSCFGDLGSRWRTPFMLRNSISQIIVTQPEWRPDLAPIFGVGERIRAAIASSPIFKDLDKRPSALDEESKMTQVADFLRMLRDSRIGVFFGHGEIDPKRGSYFVVNDGPVGEYEIAASARITSFLCQLFVACACSGVNSNSEYAFARRDLTGAHLAMLRGGVRFVVGNVEPLFPVVAIRMLETFFGDLNDDVSFDQALRRVYVALAENPATTNPVFWGHIVGFGNGIDSIAKGELRA